MTLFTLLIVLALERVVVKSQTWHIAHIANQYFGLLQKWLPSKSTAGNTTDTHQDNNAQQGVSAAIVMLLVAGVPAIGVWIVAANIPAVLVFALNLTILWICLGCPLTRQTYKRYLQAAHRADFQACSLHSEQFGNTGGDLSNVGKQLVLVNYRQYASVIIFFVLLGLPGVVFYSLCKEWYLLRVKDSQGSEAETQSLVYQEEEQVLFIVDWLPVRITAFGFLLVGHFSRGLPVWLESFSNGKLTAFDVLAKVAKASEELLPLHNSELHEPLQMVKLVKRNIILSLMVVSVMTLVGVIG